MYIHNAQVNKLLFFLVNVSSVSLICRAPAKKFGMGRGKRFFSLQQINKRQNQFLFMYTGTLHRKMLTQGGVWILIEGVKEKDTYRNTNDFLERSRGP